MESQIQAMEIERLANNYMDNEHMEKSSSEDNLVFKVLVFLFIKQVVVFSLDMVVFSLDIQCTQHMHIKHCMSLIYTLWKV